jgi:hypothetical protein
MVCGGLYSRQRAVQRSCSFLVFSVVHRHVDTAESNISQSFRGTNAHRLIVSGGYAGRESQECSYSRTTLANAQILT